MAVDRRIYKLPFRKGVNPEWICPTCNKGVLKGKKDSFVREELKQSKDSHGHEAWEPEWIEYTYACQFACTNPSCEEVVSNVGTGTVDVEVDEGDNGWEQSYFDAYKPTYFVPHLNIFSIPMGTTGDISKSINNSFELFFANPSSSAGHLRIALEQLLDCLKVKKYETRKGSRFLISTHQRIKILPSKYADLKDLLFAIKWLGNDASHPKGVSMDDVMDAYDIFENVLNEVFNTKSREVKKLAKKINKKRTNSS